MSKFLPDRKGQHILDLATGTADVLIKIFFTNPNVGSAYGIDLAEKMLEIGRKKIYIKNLEKQITLQAADANNIPFGDQQFDAVTMAFGIRNIEVPSKAIREMYRVLRRGGRTIILEFSLPENATLRNLHLFYLRHIVPNIGGFFSGHREAYAYLNKTIESFPYGMEFCRLLEDVGFQNIKAHPLMGGIATIYVGERI